ncbi:TPA: hypothetical protein OMK15_005766 [Klebsiella pneumoniae]|nr:hypothetical protein [Klebsiella pneumoniae]HCQ9355217.1 hypothetical protein [Klebsiella pneumoniae]
MTEIIKDLYQFTEVMEPIKLSMHQYLLMTNEPVLIQTGAVSQAQTTIPKLQELLGERKIKYILISHFESDECGGLALVLKEHPEAVAVCSETTARQLMGFGITNNVLIKKPNEIEAWLAQFDNKSFAEQQMMEWQLWFLNNQRQAITKLEELK